MADLGQARAARFWNRHASFSSLASCHSRRRDRRVSPSFRISSRRSRSRTGLASTSRWCRPRPARRCHRFTRSISRIRPETPEDSGQRCPQDTPPGAAHRLHRPYRAGDLCSCASATSTSSPMPGSASSRCATRSSTVSSAAALRVRPDRRRRRLTRFTLVAGLVGAAARHRLAVDRGHQQPHQPARHDRAEHPAAGRRPHSSRLRPRRPRAPEGAGRPDGAAHLPHGGQGRSEAAAATEARHRHLPVEGIRRRRSWSMNSRL